MKRMLGRVGKRTLSFGALLLLLVAAGGGYAAANSSGGTITVCVSHKGGGLYKASKCQKHDKKLSWGVRGQQGPQGNRGLIGPAGPLVTTLPRGQSLRGWFNFDTVAAVADQINGGAIPFGFSLASAPIVQIIPVGGPTTAQCAGSVAAPSAAVGYLCVYESTIQNVSSVGLCNSASTCPGADPFGAEVFVHSTAAGRFFVDGTWAVTAA